MFKAKIVTSEKSLEDCEAISYAFFLDCEMSSEILFKLTKLDTSNNQIKVFIRKSSYGATTPITIEREQIVNNLNLAKPLHLENYFEFDIYNKELDKYLNIDLTYKADELEELIEIVRTQLRINTPHTVINCKWLNENISNSFVIDKYIKFNDVLAQDINDFFKHIKAKTIVLTSDENKYYTCSNKLDENDLVIAKASIVCEYDYFFIPNSKLYQEPSKVLFVGEADYQVAIEQLINGNYIIGYSDNLQHSLYFKKYINDYKPQQLTDFIQSEILYASQNKESLGLIQLINQQQEVSIYQVINNKITLQGTVSKYSEQFSKYVQNYKSCLINRQNKGLQLEILFAQSNDYQDIQ